MARSCLTLLFLLVVVASLSHGSLEQLRARAGDQTQSRAVAELLRRLLGDRARDFVVSVNGSLSSDGVDVCELRSTKNNKVVAVGTTGVAVATGIYNYLKYFCNCHVSWSGDQLDLPRPLPPLTGVLRIQSQHR